MKLAAEIVGVLIPVGPIVVFGYFGYLSIWAARKDGEEDQALKSRLGVCRKTQLGR